MNRREYQTALRWLRGNGVYALRWMQPEIRAVFVRLLEIQKRRDTLLDNKLTRDYIRTRNAAQRAVQLQKEPQT
jgi:hypothetical protein